MSYLGHCATNLKLKDISFFLHNIIDMVCCIYMTIATVFAKGDCMIFNQRLVHLQLIFITLYNTLPHFTNKI